MKRCSPSYVIREMEIKTMRYQFTPIRMAKMQNTDTAKFWQGCGTTGTLLHCWWECKTAQALCKTVWQFLIKHILTIQSSNHATWYLPKEVENFCPFKNPHTGTSLVVQWLRIRLPMQRTRFRALGREDPTSRGATKPLRYNY